MVCSEGGFMKMKEENIFVAECFYLICCSLTHIESHLYLLRQCTGMYCFHNSCNTVKYAKFTNTIVQLFSIKFHVIFFNIFCSIIHKNLTSQTPVNKQKYKHHLTNKI